MRAFARLLPLVIAAAVVAAASAAASANRAKARFIPGLAAVDVYGNLEDRDFDCSGPKRLRTRLTWTCELDAGPAEYIVDVWGKSPTQIELVEGNAFVYSGNVDRLAKPFLGFLATIPYRGARPAAARTWVEANIGRQAQRRFGPVLFVVYGKARARFLEIKPA